MSTAEIKISYHAGPVGEWFGPEYTIGLLKRVERAGFQAAWFSDHFLPWFHTHGNAPQAWVWITAAAAQTTAIPVGSAVTVPMFKYHPLVVAQAFSTMGRLFPGRILLGVGTGEAVNEMPFIDNWPPWKERGKIAAEALKLIRKYWSESDYFDFKGEYFRVKGVLCYSKPKNRIPIYWSAFGPKSAKIGGAYADHVIAYGSPNHVRERVFPQFMEGAKSAGRDKGKIEACVYIDGGYGDIKKLIRKYRLSAAGSMIPENFNERDPRKIEASGRKLDDKYIIENGCFFSSADELIDLIEKYRKAGMNHFQFGDVGYDPVGTVEMFRTKVFAYYGIKQEKHKEHRNNR